MISVIIPFSGKKLDQLDEQLISISAQEVNQEVEVIIVCNKADLRSHEIIRYNQNSQISFKLIHANDASGASYARNVGVDASKGENLLFCDSDDVVHKGWINALSSGLENYHLVGGALKPFVDNGSHRIPYPPIKQLNVKFDFLPFASSSNFAVRREVFFLLGGFSTIYFGCEDTEFCWRALDEGFSIGFIANAVIDYRLRNNFKAAFAQHFQYGSYDCKLARAWKLSRKRTFPWKQLFKSIILISFPILILRGRYRRTLGVCLGYVLGYSKSLFLFSIRGVN